MLLWITLLVRSSLAARTPGWKGKRRKTWRIVGRQESNLRANMENFMKLVNDHYELGLPWKYALLYLANNDASAQAKLRYLSNRFLMDNTLFQK